MCVFFFLIAAVVTNTRIPLKLQFLYVKKEIKRGIFYIIVVKGSPTTKASTCIKVYL